jgi:hypothetical protein
MNRILRAIIPTVVFRSMMMRMFEKMPSIANPPPQLGTE